MIHRPAFKPCFHLATVEDEGTFLLSEQGHFVLTGHLNDLVVPLIDGRRTADDIADHLRGAARMEEVYYALAMLEKSGHLVEADDDAAPETAAFWTALGIDTHAARERLARTRVAVRSIGGVSTKGVARTLHGLGLDTAPRGELTIVLADDYLQPELEEINAEHLDAGTPWLLAKPSGVIHWIGPIFVPGRTGCWRCLAQRLRGNREVESYLERRGQTGPFPVSRAQTPASLEQTIQMMALQSAIYVAAGQSPSLEGRIITLNTASLQTERHVLVRRPQCPACGDPEEHRRGDRLVAFTDTARTHLQDGGRRSTTPEATYERFRHHVSPITGVVSTLLPASGTEDTPLRVYVAGHNFALKNDTLYFLRDGLRSKSCGKGMTDAQARASALCEAVERYSGLYRGEEKVVRATFRDLGDAALHPNACMLFSERQYRERLFWLARNSRFQVVPLPFREDAPLDWTPVHSISRGGSRYVPTGYLYYGYPIREEDFFFWADSNGNAAGNTMEEAILQGFLELVERDSVCLWWYSRVRRPEVDLDSLREPYLDRIREYYRERHREFWVLDLTTDTGIPAFAAVNRRTDHPVEDIIIGFGAHLDARVAILRAVAEMNQFMPAVLQHRPDGTTEYTFHDPESVLWWQTATLANQPYLQPLPSAFTRRLPDYRDLSAGSINDDVQTCVSTAERLGLEMLVLDQTRPDIGLNVVKVLVPGLRHFWARFAPGRLYDVPVRLGWLPAPLPETGLNPIPMFV